MSLYIGNQSAATGKDRAGGQDSQRRAFSGYSGSLARTSLAHRRLFRPSAPARPRLSHNGRLALARSLSLSLLLLLPRLFFIL
jgi:hypothetical protein